MKSIVTAIIFALISVSLSAQLVVTPFDSSIWYNDYDKALVTAKEKNLPVLIVFSGSDWCKPCIKLRENILVKEPFSVWAKTNAVMVTADFPRQKKNALAPEQVAKNEKLAEKYNPNGVFPLVVIIKSDETIVGQSGYLDISPEDYILKLQEIINK